MKYYLKKQKRIKIDSRSVDQIQKSIETDSVEILNLKRLIARYSTVRKELAPIVDKIKELDTKINLAEREIRKLSNRIKYMFNPQDLELKQKELDWLKKQKEINQTLRNQRLPEKIHSFADIDREILVLEQKINKTAKEISEDKNVLDSKLKEQNTKEIIKRKEALKKEKEEKIKAKLAAVDKKSRELGGHIRKRIKGHQFCSYCFKEIRGEGHADHIYPIALGGLSTENNMTMVCKECNSNKVTMTLREFIEEYKLDRNKIEENLKKFGKKF